MKNDYEIRGDVTAIFINYKDDRFECMIDTADFEKPNSLPNTWFLSDTGYVRGCFRKGTPYVRMHRFIMNAPKGLDVDHINGNKLDNRKLNLRVVSRSQNLQNQRLNKGNTKSGIRGVAWFARDSKWRAYINNKRKQVHLGYFDTKEEAAFAASKARKKHYPYSNENKEVKHHGG